jgi:hypothetical protein
MPKRIVPRQPQGQSYSSSTDLMVLQSSANIGNTLYRVYPILAFKLASWKEPKVKWPVAIKHGAFSATLITD